MTKKLNSYPVPEPPEYINALEEYLLQIAKMYGFTSINDCMHLMEKAREALERVPATTFLAVQSKIIAELKSFIPKLSIADLQMKSR
jgi:hypothetical protein